MGDERSLAMVLNSLGGVLQRLGKFQEAADALERSHDLLAKQRDTRGQAMVLNSLGGVLQRLGNLKRADESFARSISMGEQLNDQVHLAKVRTAYGKVLVSRGELSLGIDHLSEGFRLDEGNHNGRGLAIVTPLLVNNLRKIGRSAEAVEFLDRALAVAPYEKALQHLSMAGSITVASRPAVQLTGRVKRILAPMGRPRYGFMTADGDGTDIYFSENQIGTDVFSSLSEGKRVAADVVVMPHGRRQAQAISII
jgi:tetratricopeptide (TPR) repeat protein